MRTREPDSSRLVKAFGPNIFFDDFCREHDRYIDDPFHDQSVECDIEDIPSLRCPFCQEVVPVEFIGNHVMDLHPRG